MKDKLDTLGAWALGLLWILPLAYAMWAAFHPPAYATRFDLFAPLTLDNFVRAWNAAPFRATSSTPSCWSRWCWPRSWCCPRWPATPSRVSSSVAATLSSCWCCCS